MYMKKRVLITGGAGYIGSILCEHLLDAGYAVSVLDKPNQNSLFHLCSNPDFRFTYGDVLNESLIKSLLKDVDVIVPLAAIVGAPACKKDPLLAEPVNTNSIRMLNGLRSRNQLVVFTSTNSGYKVNPEGICTEDTPIEPISLYAKTKVEAEAELLGSENTISLRLASVFGMSPRMRLDLLLHNFVYEAVTRNYLVIFEKDFTRNYIHVRDVADCIIHSIENSEQMVGMAYNVGLDSANITKQELALKIKEYVPKFYIHYADINSDMDKRNYLISNQRLREAGFEAKRTLDEGIVELIKGFSAMGSIPTW